MRYLAVIIAVFLSNFAFGQKLTVTAPNAVEVGKQFQVTYTLNDKGRGFQAPDFGGLDLMGGPFTGQSSSRQIINGKVSSQRQFTYTYALRASKTGTYTIGPASIKANGKRIQSKSTRIKVVNGTKPQTQNSGEPAKADIFVRTFVSQKEVYEGEAITCTVKLFTKNQFDLTDYKEPKFTGFHKEEIDVPNVQVKQEAYNDQVYHTLVIKKYLLYPTQTGDLEIAGATLDATARTYRTRKARNRHEQMFYGNTIKVPVDKQLTLKAPSRTISVRSLPAQGKPASFNGFVGNLSLESDISFTEIEVDKAINLNYVLKGLGNIDLLTLSKPIFPPDFDVFDPEISQKTNPGDKGLSGSKSFKYILIPRTEGTFEIPSLEFSYFDSQKREYVTLTSETYTIKVGSGVNTNTEGKGASYSDGKEVHYVDKDIRYIQQNVRLPEHKQKHLMQRWITPAYFSLSPLLLLAFIFWKRKRNKDHQDVQLMRYKKANKLAKKHLGKAHKMLQEEKHKEFYVEISKVLWGYLSDKFTIPRSNLSIEEIMEQLSIKGLNDESIEEIKKVLELCEFARFAPEEENRSHMQHIYEDSLAIISKIEKGIK